MHVADPVDVNARGDGPLAQSPEGRWGLAMAAGIGLLLGTGILLLSATHNESIVGNLDDIYVVLHESRGWLLEWGLLDGGALQGLGRPAVEGSTSALDVVVKSASMAIAPEEDQVVIAGWISLVWMLVTVGVVSLSAARLFGSRLWSPSLAMGFATSLGLVESASYRLEGPLFALLWTGLLLLAAHRRAALAWPLAVLVAATRPEALVLAPLAWGLSAHGSALTVVRRLGAAAAIPAIVTTARLLVFGSWAPNAYFAKTSDSRWAEVVDGARYLDAALRTPAGLAWLVLACTAGWGAYASWCGRRVKGGAPPVVQGAMDGPWLLGISLIAAAIVVGSGGDSYLGSRLALPLAMPAWLAVASFSRSSPRVAWTGAAVALALQASAIGPALRNPVAAWESTRERLAAGPSGEETFAGDREVFHRVAEALGSETLAHRHIQRFRWFEPNTPVLDLTGITDPSIARLPQGDHVLFGRDAISEALARRVGAIFLDVRSSRPRAWAQPHPAHLETERLVRQLSDPVESQSFLGPPPLARPLADAIVEQYLAASIRHPGTGGTFNLLVRRDLAADFRGEGFAVNDGP